MTSSNPPGLCEAFLTLSWFYSLLSDAFPRAQLGLILLQGAQPLHGAVGKHGPGLAPLHNFKILQDFKQSEAHCCIFGHHFGARVEEQGHTLLPVTPLQSWGCLQLQLSPHRANIPA